MLIEDVKLCVVRTKQCDCMILVCLLMCRMKISISDTDNSMRRQQCREKMYG